MPLYVECGYVEHGYIEGDEVCAPRGSGGRWDPVLAKKWLPKTDPVMVRVLEIASEFDLDMTPSLAAAIAQMMDESKPDDLDTAIFTAITGMTPDEYADAMAALAEPEPEEKPLTDEDIGSLWQLHFGPKETVH